MPAKKRRNTKQPKKQPKKINKQKLTTLMLSFLAITLMITIASYFFLPSEDVKSDKEKNTNIKSEFKKYTTKQKNNFSNESYEPYSEKFEEYTKEFEKDYANIEEIKKDIINIIEDRKKTQTVKTEEKPKIVEATKKEPKETIIDNRPKLAIIIDDVTNQSQVNRIQDIGYNVTMSILPPMKTHKDSAKIAQNLDFYMVHFPMQAKSFKFEESDTLHINDSYEKIEKRVAQIRKWYPNAKYTNNHTGSKFTSNDKSMDYLFKALKKYDFIFVDSRTTAKTVAQKYAKKYDMPFLARNIFLDNKIEYNYIQNQLKKAIEIAKKSGYSIAIGHPYKMTTKVLKESKHLLEGINLVYIDKIPTS